MAAATVSVDEFQALEQKVLQTVELIKMERAARAACEAEAKNARAAIAAAEAKADDLLSQLADKDAEVTTLREQIAAAGSASELELDTLRRERESVRQRVEKMLYSLEELG